MADIDYEVEVTVRCKGEVVDFHELKDEDYGWAMRRLASWARLSLEEKDL